MIEAQTASCGFVNGIAPVDFPKTPAETATKVEIVAALKASFDSYDKAYASVTDANATEILSAGRGKRSRIGLLWGKVSHDNEQYAQLATYIRLKNITQPSVSEK